MLTHRLLPCALLIALVVPSAVSAQRQASVIDTARARAKAPYETGLAQIRAEAYDAALKSFQQAIDLDGTFDLAYYMLGRTHMALRNYVAATIALSKCRDLYQADSTRQFTTKSERQQVLRDHIRDVEQLIDETKKAADDPRNANYRFTYLENIRQYEERKRQLQDQERNDSLQGTNPVPAFVSLALGSAYFRSGKMQDAEQAYLATVAADPKVGEAHNNLAVVYMETGRFDQAEKAVKAAEKTGLKVQKALKDEIEKRKKAGS